jgi:transcriptional regulator with XRE-family HTH domain
MEPDDSQDSVAVPFSPIGPRIRKRREELGLSCAELAERLNGTMTTQDVEWLETERIFFPSWIRLQRLAEALQMSPQKLVEKD